MKIHLRGIDLAFDEAGEGTAIVFLHGYPFNRTMWDEQAAFFSRRGYRCVVPDLRGLGESTEVGESGPEDKHATMMEEMARDAALLMDSLEIDRAVICGLSMGSYVALEFVRLFPARVLGLIVCGARAQGADDKERQSREEQAARIVEEGLEPVAEAMLSKVFARRTLEEKPQLVARVREMIVQTHRTGAAAAQRGMAARRDHSSFLAEIRIPTLVIAGREDSIRSPEDAEFLHQHIRQSWLETIADAGHLMNLEQPEVFNDKLVKFLDVTH